VLSLLIAVATYRKVRPVLSGAIYPCWWVIWLEQAPGGGWKGIMDPKPAKIRACTEAIKYHGYEAIKKDIDALKKALESRPGVDGFIAALGPLSLGAGIHNLFYKNERDYMFAVADAAREAGLNF